MRALERLWYGGSALSGFLLPLSALFALLSGARRWLYRRGILRAERLPVPVVVVGNLTVGGTGKTPLLLCLAELLRQRGLAAGIVSRGYGGGAPRYPLRVEPGSDPALAGDEPVLLAQRSGCPVAVDPDRPRAARLLLEQQPLDVILSDDGLQHYRLARDYEIVVLDGQRRLGNRRLLPAGPLREPPRRMQRADCVLINGGENWEPAFHLRPQAARPLDEGSGGGRGRELASFRTAPVHVLAGIGHPQRFFRQLRDLGLEVIEHAYPDHHRFSATDLRLSGTAPVLMTEKDAVKCRALLPQLDAGRYWYVPVRAELNEHALHALRSLWSKLPAQRATDKQNG